MASLQLLPTLPGCYGEKRFGEISLAEGRDFVLIDVKQKGRNFLNRLFGGPEDVEDNIQSFICETLGIYSDIHIYFLCHF